MEVNMVYIYKIKNNLNGKVYVGKTKNLKERRATHFREYRDLNNSKALYQAMRKYGEENFSFKVLEKCSESNWGEREQYWIEKYNSLTSGYNMIPGGSEPPRMTGENHPLSILTWTNVHDIKRDLLKGDLSMKDISIKYNISIDQIYRINTGKSWSEKEDTYPIRKPNKTDSKTLNQIVWMLQNTSVTQKEIGKKFSLSRTTITAINLGKNHYNPNLSYPLRKGRHYNHK